MCRTLSEAGLSYCHDCVANTILVDLDEAEAAVLALMEAGQPHSGIMRTVSEAEWPSGENDGVEQGEIDFDPREEWCAGPAPRLWL